MIWQYLTGLGTAYTSDAMTNGKEVHKYLEEHPVLPAVKDIIGKTKKYWVERKIEKELDLYKLVGILDLSTPKYIVDYKTGKSIQGYEKQLQFYGYLNFLETGKIPNYGVIVQVEGLRDKEDKIIEVEVLKTKVFDLDEKVLGWEDILYEMYNEIMFEIEKGSLDKFLKLNQ